MAGYIENKDAVLPLLHRVERQVRGLQWMVDSERYCIDVLTQISAATKASRAVALELLEDHPAHCVADAAHHGGAEVAAKVKAASDAITRFVRSGRAPMWPSRPAISSRTRRPPAAGDAMVFLSMVFVSKRRKLLRFHAVSIHAWATRSHAGPASPAAAAAA